MDEKYILICNENKKLNNQIKVMDNDFKKLLKDQEFIKNELLINENNLKKSDKSN